MRFCPKYGSFLCCTVDVPILQDVAFNVCTNWLDTLNYVRKLKEKEIALSKKKKAEITLANQTYLEENQILSNELMDLFRKYSRRFYTNKSSGLSIQLNSKDNKLAFNIEADIEGDVLYKIKIKPEDIKLLDIDLSNGMNTELRIKYDSLTWFEWVLKKIGIIDR